jgi:hypothetical protein
MVTERASASRYVGPALARVRPSAFTEPSKPTYFSLL